MISQLSLFDIATTKVGSSYKPGDWVKIRKVPKIAKHVKCGHLYKIHAVDPTDGRLQFWNPFAAQWDFLLPAEVKLALVPVCDDDSVTTAEVAVTESNCQHSETDTIPPLEAVTESNYPPGKNDSVTPVEVAVTESTLQPGNDDFLALNAVSPYKPRGTARSGQYFRLSYREGGRVRHLHIKGGNTDSPIAQAKVAEVRSLLASGMSPAQVAATLKNT